ncbi:glycoside hydrolase family 16 protein [Streptomyces sp. NPDC001286]
MRLTSGRPHTPARLAVGVLVTGLLLSCSASPSGDTQSTPDGWRLSWSDEFSGTAGKAPDPDKWTHDTGGEPQWGNKEWQFYTDRPQNAATDGHGHLVITARRERLPGMDGCPDGTCDITSARLTTKGTFSQTYGKIEARIKVPADGPFLPAFWMMGDNDDTTPWPGNGEIDVMEVAGGEPDTVYGTIHGPGYGDEGIGGHHTLRGGSHFSDAFHTYGVEWDKDRITWSVDGHKYHTDSRASHGPGRKWIFDHDFYLLLNLAVGGVWPGPVAPSTAFPVRMLTDWVRVYERARPR